MSGFNSFRLSTILSVIFSGERITGTFPWDWRFRAYASTGEQQSFLPRPDSAGGFVKTATKSCTGAMAFRAGTAISGVPAKTTFIIASVFSAVF